jgi:polysaccharide pyruvyl transferase WcaK-like protein
MSTVVFEIHGTGTHNRGAELMAIAVAARLRQTRPDVRLAVSSQFGTFEERARHGFLTVDDFPGRFRTRLYAQFAPKGFRQAMGLVCRSEPKGVIDASGFAFSDNWGPGLAEALIGKMEQSARRGQKLVLLPQSFGPFRNREVASACRRLLSRADLVYARDPDSLAAVQALGGTGEPKLCPDFTASLPGFVPADLVLPERFAAIVPNFRMLDKTHDLDGTSYLAFLELAIHALREGGQNPLIVLHDAWEDRQVFTRLFARVGEMPVIEHRDPQVLKGVLGRAHLVVGSRFHALVSALSQGVPCIGAGWSHKYRWLFQDFNCPEYLIEDISSRNAFVQALSSACDLRNRESLIITLRNSKHAIEERVEAMWREVVRCLN